MTKEEILTLINEKISGQGSQVDIGGALPSILGAILDATTGLQFGGVLSNGASIPLTPNMFYVAGAGSYMSGESGEEVEEWDIEDGSIAFFIVNARSVVSASTIAITTGGGSGGSIPVVEELPEDGVNDGDLCMTIDEETAVVYIFIADDWRTWYSLPL